MKLIKNTALAIALVSLTACTTGNNSNLHSHTQQTTPVVPKNSYNLIDEHIKRHNPEISVNGQSLADGKLNLTALGTGLHTQNVVYSSRGNPIANRTLRIYKQPNSVVINDRTPHPHGVKAFDAVSGVGTTTLPISGVYRYTGKAFDDKNEGQFNYAIDFEHRTGQGDFVLNDNKTVLYSADISNQKFDNQYTNDFSGFGIHGDASDGGSYALGIFGVGAEEVAGIATINDKVVGFGGSKTTNH